MPSVPQRIRHSVCAKLDIQEIRSRAAWTMTSVRMPRVPTAPIASTRREATSASVPRDCVAIPTRENVSSNPDPSRANADRTQIVRRISLAKRAPASVHALDCSAERMPSVRSRTTVRGVDAASVSAKDGTEIVFHVSSVQYHCLASTNLCMFPFQNAKGTCAEKVPSASSRTVDPPANAHPGNTEIPSPAAPVSLTSARPLNRARRLRCASVAAASTVVMESSVELAPIAMPTPESASASHRSLEIPIYFACPQQLILNATRNAEAMPTASTASAPTSACATREPQETPMKDVVPRRRRNANPTRVDSTLNAVRDSIRSTASAPQGSMAIRTSSASILTSALAWLVDKVPFASTRPEATIAAANLAIMEIPSRCAPRLNWTTAMTQPGVRAALKFNVPWATPVTEDVARTCAIASSAALGLPVTLESASAHRDTRAIQRI